MIVMKPAPGHVKIFTISPDASKFPVAVFLKKKEKFDKCLDQLVDMTHRVKCRKIPRG